MNKIWVKTSEVTLAQLQEWENNYEKKQVIRRIASGLFRTDQSGLWEVQIARIVRGRDNFAGKTYKYRYFPGEEETAEITVEIEDYDKECIEYEDAL